MQHKHNSLTAIDLLGKYTKYVSAGSPHNLHDQGLNGSVQKNARLNKFMVSWWILGVVHFSLKDDSTMTMHVRAQTNCTRVSLRIEQDPLFSADWCPAPTPSRRDRSMWVQAEWLSGGRVAEASLQPTRPTSNLPHSFIMQFHVQAPISAGIETHHSILHMSREQLEGNVGSSGCEWLWAEQELKSSLLPSLHRLTQTGEHPYQSGLQWFSDCKEKNTSPAVRKQREPPGHGCVSRALGAGWDFLRTSQRNIVNVHWEENMVFTG